MLKKNKKKLFNRIIVLSIIVGITLPILILVMYNSYSTYHERILRVGQYDNKPKVYEENGRVVGIFPDLLEHIALKEGWKIEWVNGTWIECLQRLEDGDLDTMIDVAYSEQREERFLFNNEEVLNNWGIIYKKAGVDISTIEDLENKIVAVMAGSIHTDGEEGIKNLVKKKGINCVFKEVDDYNEVFKMLDEGNADVGVVNRLFGILNKEGHQVEPTSIIFNPAKLLFAFPKNAEASEYYIEKIDISLREMKEVPDSYYYQVINKYLYGNLVPSWVFPTLIIAFFLICTFVSISYILNRKVNARTIELKRAHDELETKVEERTKELSIANELLRGLDQLKSMFIASTSHELRTPLTSIIGFTDVLLKGWVGEINEEQTKQLTIILNSANHLLELINDIIDTSKIEAEKINLRKEKFDLAKQLHDVKETFQVAADKKSLKLSIEIEENFTIYNDKRRINQIVVNLIGNAIKFTDEGSVSIKAQKKSGRIEISVKDTGVGIREDDLEKIFKPFIRIIEPGKFKEGTGLGLHLSKKLAYLLKGDIRVESKFGKGSTFTLSLEITDEEKK